MAGYVKLFRTITDWEHWGDANMLQMWVYLLVAASTTEKKWRNITIGRGQLVTTMPELSEKTKLTYKAVRTCLDKLTKSGEIGRQTTNKYSIITICNYESYQDSPLLNNQSKGRQNGRQTAVKGQTNGQSKGRQTEKETTPHTPLKEKELQEREEEKKIYYYSSLRAHTREQEEKQQLFFVFYLKGAVAPKEERENFISWNTTPDRIAAWQKCPEEARYSTAERWAVKGRKLPGHSDTAEKALTAIARRMIQSYPNFVLDIYNPHKYPLIVNKDTATLTCTDNAYNAVEMAVNDVQRILQSNGITSLQYIVKKTNKSNENGK